MRGLTCALLCLLVAAVPARADTFKGRASAGPALAGDTVLWGEELEDGRAILYSRAPGQPRRVLVRIPAGEKRGHRRGFGHVPGGVSASPSRLVYTASELFTRSTGPDTAVSTGHVTPLLSSAGGPFTNPLGTCVGNYVSTAIEGDSVAIAVNAELPCGGVYVNGRKVSEVLDVRQVRLAGPYVAWEQWPGGAGSRITVADAATGAFVADYPAPRNRAFGEFDIDERGTVVTTMRNRLVTFSAAAPQPRTLARDVDPGSVAVAAGRVAYRTLSPGRLLVAELATGRVVRRLERYGQGRWSVGEIVLTDRHVVWSVRSGAYENTYAPGSIRIARL